MAPRGSLGGRRADLDRGHVATLPPERGGNGRPVVAVQLGPVTTDPVEEQLNRVAGRLLAETEGDAGAQQEVLRHLTAARERFAHATVRQFLPILVEREARRRMRDGVRPK
jgi:hypothetical protein